MSKLQISILRVHGYFSMGLCHSIKYSIYMLCPRYRGPPIGQLGYGKLLPFEGKKGNNLSYFLFASRDVEALLQGDQLLKELFAPGANNSFKS